MMKKTTYDKAVIRLKRIKSFYRHLFIYILFLVFWLVFANDLLSSLGNLLQVPEHGTSTFVNINMWLNPLIWGTVVLIHGIIVFGSQHSMFKHWEKRKIKKYMDEETVIEKNQWE